MQLGFSLTPFGHHPAAWRAKASTDALGFDALLAQVIMAEQAGLDFVLLADRLGARPLDRLSSVAVPFEPTTLASALATRARHIGFLVAASTRQHEPYNLARRFASLDQIASGRTGWAMVGTAGEDGRDREYAVLVSDLWNSWEDDAFMYDKAGGRFFHPDKMHVLDHQGENFAVRGPLNVNRSPQGKPVLAHLFTGATRDLATGLAEVIILQASDPAEAAAVISDILRGLERQARKRADIRILVNVIPYAASTQEEAQALHDRLQADMSGEAEWPIVGCAVIGTAEAIAEALQTWVDAGDIDGFNILPPTLTVFGAFLADVVPVLRRHGISPGRGATLRERLDLQRPVHPAAGLERVS